MTLVYIRIESLSQQHVRLADGVRQYMHQHTLDWDLRLVNSEDITSAQAHAYWIVFREHSLPDTAQKSCKGLCVLFPQTDSTNARCFSFDQQAFGMLATRHLRDQGYKTVGVIHRDRALYRNRWQAIEQSCRQFGLHFSEHIHENEQGIDDLVTWMRASPQAFAIYAYTDQQAAWLRDLALNAGLRIPADCAILGTSDLQRFCIKRNPTLSSIAYPWPLIGQAAGAYIHHLIQGIAPPPCKILRPLTVSTRESTAARHIGNPLVKRAFIWLSRHLNSKRPIEEVAAYCNCSDKTLAKHFRSEFGTSPKKIHDRLRCDQAAALLSQANLTISQVAKRSGFASVHALDAAFKRRHNLTPTQWRQATV